MLTKQSLPKVALIGVGIIGIGVLSACGTSTASENPSPTESVSREAGMFSKKVNLDTVNETGQSIDISETATAKGGLKAATMATSTVANRALPAGASTEFTHERPGIVIKNAKNNTADYFIAVNPDIGSPTVKYSDRTVAYNNYSGRTLAPAESFTWKSPSSGRIYVVTRGEDTETKMITIKILN